MRSELSPSLSPGKGCLSTRMQQHAARELAKRARTALEPSSGLANAKTHLSTWHACAGGALVGGALGVVVGRVGHTDSSVGTGSRHAVVAVRWAPQPGRDQRGQRQPLPALPYAAACTHTLFTL